MAWITTTEASRRYGYSAPYIRKLCSRGKLTAVRHAGQWMIAVGDEDPEEFGFMSVAELCEETGLGRYKAHYRLRTRKIPGVRYPRCWSIPRSAVEESTS